MEESVALLETNNVPLYEPTPPGAKTTSTDVLWEGASFKGTLVPATLKPVPRTNICEMVTSAFPVFCSSTICVADLPPVTVPKFTAVDPTERANLALTIWPLTVRDVPETGELVTIDTCPFTVAAAVGFNSRLNDVLSPAVKVLGPLNPLILRPVPLAITCEMVSEPPPEFETLRVCDAVTPTMAEKLTLGGVISSCGAAVDLGAGDCDWL